MYSPSDLPYKLASLTIFGTEVPPEWGQESVIWCIKHRQKLMETLTDPDERRAVAILCGFVPIGSDMQK